MLTSIGELANNVDYVKGEGDSFATRKTGSEWRIGGVSEGDYLCEVISNGSRSLSRDTYRYC